MNERAPRGGGPPGDAETDAALRHGEGEAPRPGEEELFAALDRTRADLAAAPRPAAPEGLAAALEAALAAERSASGPPPGRPVPTRPGRPRPPSRPPSLPPSRPPGRRQGTRRRLLAGGLVAVAVAAVVAGVVGVAGVGSGQGAGPRPPAPTAAPAPPGPDDPLVLSTRDLPQALRSGLGAREAGPGSDPAGRAGCLAAHGLPAGTVPAGTRAVVLDGRPGTLHVLTTGRAAVFRLLVVGPACAPGSPDTLADVEVGG
ncbi:hypothetical protein WCD74_19545 [Actinomycetospora sp. OC33-EN08]|uniref:Uncharacterized protein n=1 Tax=Actinomycetospora aurantiaca TaxID=3129233 RepID=A0ABU8MRN0_9PSEU